MPSREVRTGNMNSVHDDLLSDIFNENTKYNANHTIHTIQYWSTKYFSSVLFGTKKKMEISTIHRLRKSIPGEELNTSNDAGTERLPTTCIHSKMYQLC